VHGPIVTTLTENPILTLFIVIGLGYLLGEISFFGFRFGIVGVLFVGLAVGSLSPAISVPEVIPTLGLIIFIYTIGIQSGPEFFRSLRERGYRDSAFALVIVVLGAGVTLLVSRPAHLTRPRVAGLYTGAMTNTPALAAGANCCASAASLPGSLLSTFARTPTSRWSPTRSRTPWASSACWSRSPYCAAGGNRRWSRSRTVRRFVFATSR